MRRHGLTLIELIVAVSIVGVLVALLLSAIQAARETSRRTSCQSNLHQLGLSLSLFHESKGHLPSGLGRPAPNMPPLSWMAQLLPYLEQDTTWQAIGKYSMVEPDPHRHPYFTWPQRIFACASDGRAATTQVSRGRLVGLTSYLGISGTDASRRDGALFLESANTWASFADGLSNTVVVGERPASFDMYYGWWYTGGGVDGKGTADVVLGVRELNPPGFPDTATCASGPYQFSSDRMRNPCALLHYWSLHPGGGSFLLGDGAVVFLAYDGAEALAASATLAGGEPNVGL